MQLGYVSRSQLFSYIYPPRLVNSKAKSMINSYTKCPSNSYTKCPPISSILVFFLHSTDFKINILNFLPLILSFLRYCSPFSVSELY
jgi:hypothetical protein